jgi:hypothetical protein
MKAIVFTIAILNICFYMAVAQDGKNTWRIKSNYGILMPDSSWVACGNVSYINKTDTITSDSVFADKDFRHYTFKGNVILKTYQLGTGSTAVLTTDKLEYSRKD